MVLHNSYVTWIGRGCDFPQRIAQCADKDMLTGVDTCFGPCSPAPLLKKPHEALRLSGSCGLLRRDAGEQCQKQPFMCIRKSTRGSALGGRSTNCKSYSLTWSTIVGNLDRIKGHESRDFLLINLISKITGSTKLWKISLFQQDFTPDRIRTAISMIFGRKSEKRPSME